MEERFTVFENYQIAEIRQLIELNQSEENLEEIYKLIFDLNNYNTSIYHEALYLLGIFFLKRYSGTQKCFFAYEALIAFASADNSYLALNNRSCERYLDAINFTKNLYRSNNINSISK